MEYTNTEKQILELLDRTNFKNLSKNDVLTYALKLNELRPEVVTQVITQYPEFVELMQSLVSEYRGIIGKIIESDDASLQHFYDSTDKVMDDSAVGREQFFRLAEKVQADYSKCLDKEITAEEQADILKGELEILRMATEKEKEVREQQEKTLTQVDHKDSEKRLFNWGLIGAASTVLVAAICVGIAAWDGKVDLKLPKK